MNKIYIIAEAGVNHNGSLDLAIELIHKASEVGANCVKFQTYKTEQLVSKNSPKAKYQLQVTSEQESQYDMLKKLELRYEDYPVLLEKCMSLDIDFMSTPYNNDDIDFLDLLGVSAFKIASGQLTELPFLRYAAKKMKKMIISTGMAYMSDVDLAVETIRAMGNDDIVVLQCTTNYPSLIEDANLLVMNSIRDACKVNVGYSDHVESNYACFAAAAMGAKVIEKHFTLDKQLSGPDHSSSLNPSEFKELVFGIRSIEKSLGNGIKRPTEAEKNNIYGMKRSIVVLEHLPVGTVLTTKNIGYKRPLNGLSPNNVDLILGKKLKKALKKDEPLTYNSIEWE